METLENSQIAAVFYEMGDLLEIQGGNLYRIRAFRRVAQVIENLPEPAGRMLAAGSLAEVPGVGEGSLGRIRELLETGGLAEHQELRRAVPPGLLEMLQLEGLGPKTVAMLHTALGVGSVDELEAAARDGKIRSLPRMGEKSEAKILKAIEVRRRMVGRVLLRDALPLGLALVAGVRACPAVLAAELAGSARRRRETVGDLDVLVASRDAAAAMDRFVALPQVAEIMERGPTKCAVRLKAGLQADLRVVAPETFGAALHYFSGSKLHNIAVRDRAKRRGLKVSEYGVFRESDEVRLGGATEEEVFAAVGLPFIPPEIRENQGEIEAADEGRLPRLLELADLRGELHAHTDASDGAASAREMAEAARALGHEYLAITDHSRALAMTHGLDERRLAAQGTMIRELEQELGGIRLLRGIEVDILADGALDLDPAALAELDWVVASVHSHFSQTEEEMTARVVRALESGVVDCLGHPTGRILGGREPFAIDLGAVLAVCKRLGVAVELNAFPERLDLDAPHLRRAKEEGVAVCLDTDAHAAWHLARRDFGVYTARRGWLEADDVLNAGPLAVIAERRAARLRRGIVAAAGSKGAAKPERAPKPKPPTRKAPRKRNPEAT